MDYIARAVQVDGPGAEGFYRMVPPCLGIGLDTIGAEREQQWRMIQLIRKSLSHKTFAVVTSHLGSNGYPVQVRVLLPVPQNRP